MSILKELEEIADKYGYDGICVASSVITVFIFIAIITIGSMLTK